MRSHTYRTRSGAWASVHHIGTTRVHWSPAAPPLSGRTHPPCSDGRTVWFHHSTLGSALQSTLSQPHPSPPHVCACTPPSASQRRSWVSICYHSPYCPCTTGSFKSRNLYKPIYSGTADYDAAQPQARLWEEAYLALPKRKIR